MWSFFFVMFWFACNCYYHLDLQASLFKMVLKNNAKFAMKPFLDLNHVTKLWQNLTSFQCLVMKILKYFKVAKIATSQLIGSMEGTRCFSTLVFMKSKLRNRLIDHLDLVVCKFAHKFYSLENFLYNAIIQSWKVIKVWHGY